MVKSGQKWLDIPFLAIFGHFLPTLPAYGQPLYYIFAFFYENGIIGCCCNDICKEKATPGCITTLFFQHLPEIQFLAIFHHFYLLKGNPLIQPLLLLTKLLSLRAVATISTEREQLQAITTPFSYHLPEN